MKKITKNLLALQGKLTLREFSEKCGIGQSTMHNYLHGREVKSDMIVKICKGTGCSADWLIGLKGSGKIGDVKIRLATAINHLNAQQEETKLIIKQLGGCLDTSKPCGSCGKDTNENPTSIMSSFGIRFCDYSCKDNYIAEQEAIKADVEAENVKAAESTDNYRPGDLSQVKTNPRHESIKTAAEKSIGHDMKATVPDGETKVGSVQDFKA